MIDVIKYVVDFMKLREFDSEAIEALSGDIEKIYSDNKAKGFFEECIATYESDINTDYRQMLDKADRAGESAGVHEYSAELLLLICLTKPLRTEYAKRGLPDELWFDTTCSLKWSAMECKLVKGMYGSFVADWLTGFFNMTRFELGRLQFEIDHLKFDHVVRGKLIKAGELAIAIHIPRNNRPLTPENRMDSYRRAVALFKDMFDGKPVLFSCYSWLLSEEIRPMLKEGSNLQIFYDDFDLVRFDRHEKGEYPDAWRLFGMDCTENVDDYPEDTSLRKAYKSYIKSGKIASTGLGFFFADDVIG